MKIHNKNITRSLKLFFVFGLVLGGLVLVHTRKTVAACANTGTAGSVDVSVTTTNPGNYTIWSRIMAKDTTNDSFLLDINDGTCYQVNNKTLTPNTWVWVNYAAGNTASKITADLKAGTNTFTLVGSEQQVKVDRIIAVMNSGNNADCVPIDTGNNCILENDTTKPTVSVTSPTNGAPQSGTVVVNVAATDVGGIAKVDIYIDNVLAKPLTATPYSYTFAAASFTNGTHSLSAKATDTSNNQASSSVVNMVIANAVANKAPTASMTSSGTNFTAPATVNLTATATDSDGTIAKVEFYNGNTKIGEKNTNPYTFTWSNVAAGTYTLTAKAIDDKGLITVTSPITATVVATPAGAGKDTQAPTAPTNLKRSMAFNWGRYVVNFNWTTSSDNVAVTKYNIIRNNTLIGTSASTSFTDQNISADIQYTYKVEAEDAAGNKSTTANTSLIAGCVLIWCSEK